jgi:type I restriction enzyme S subunit
MLPEGWRVVRFDEMAQLVNDRVDNPSEAGVERYVGLEHLDPESLRIRRWGSPDDVEAQKLRFHPGDIIFGKRRAYQRKLAVADFEGICSAHAMVLRAREETVVKEFLPFFMQSDTFFESALSISVGSLSPTINWKTLASQHFSIPPKDEQRRIAEILWTADENYQAREKVLEEIIQLRQLVIDDLLSDASGKNAVALRDVCKMQNGRPFPSDDYRSSGVKLLRPGNLGSDGYFYWSENATKFLPDNYLQTAADFLVEENDVVINLTAQSLEDGFMGRVCLAGRGDSSLLNQRIGRFRHAESIDSAYLFRCLQTSRFRKLVETSCEGSKIRHLYWRHIEGFMIPLPSKKEQKRAVEGIASVDTAIQAARKNVLDSRRLRSQLREDLLSSH